MPASISTSNRSPCLRTALSRLAARFRPGLALPLALTALAHSQLAYSQETPPVSSPESSSPSEDRTAKPEEEDFTNTPYTNYGEFNEEADEVNEALFFQYGRFFGVSIGMGYQGITGHRGLLWQGGFPLIDLKVHYWFDFNFALNMQFFTVKHYFDISAPSVDHIDINYSHIGLALKYYFDTKNLSGGISFANPFVLLGGGSYAKTETTQSTNAADPDSSFGLNAGAGLEFTIRPRKIYFGLEGKVHLVSFRDNFSDEFADRVPDLSGTFYTFNAHILFTW